MSYDNEKKPKRGLQTGGGVRTGNTRKPLKDRFPKYVPAGSKRGAANAARDKGVMDKVTGGTGKPNNADRFKAEKYKDQDRRMGELSSWMKESMGSNRMSASGRANDMARAAGNAPMAVRQQRLETKKMERIVRRGIRDFMRRGQYDKAYKMATDASSKGLSLGTGIKQAGADYQVAAGRVGSDLMNSMGDSAQWRDPIEDTVVANNTATSQYDARRAMGNNVDDPWNIG
ncbi:MAG: hypothetical protein ACPH5P_00320 [Akkermansiaceae bacterium]